MTAIAPTHSPDCTTPEDGVITATRQWIERAVIGLNLCPFAKAVYSKGLVRYVVSAATTPEALAHDLQREMEWLAEASADKTDTTLLIHPHVLTDFLDHNDFLDVADGMLETLDLEGILQVASFHPQFQFEGTAPDDITNATNRAPFPTLHLLREDSVERAVAAFPDELEITNNNIETLEKLGRTGWDALWTAPTAEKTV